MNATTMRGPSVRAAAHSRAHPSIGGGAGGAHSEMSPAGAELAATIAAATSSAKRIAGRTHPTRTSSQTAARAVAKKLPADR